MLTVFCPQLAIPIRELDRRFGQSFFNVNLPPSQANEAMLINATLAITLPESLLESCWFNRSALCDSEHFKRRSLLIIAKTMRPMWQAIVIANQFTMEGDGIIHCPAAFPMILTNARLNPKLAFNQVLPG